MIPTRTIVGYGAFVLTNEKGDIADRECPEVKETTGFVTRDNFKSKKDAIAWARDQVEEISNFAFVYGIDDKGNIICSEPHGQGFSGDDFLSFA